MRALRVKSIKSTLNALNLAIFAIFDQSREILYPEKFKNYKIAKLNILKIKYLPSLRFFFS